MRRAILQLFQQRHCDRAGAAPRARARAQGEVLIPNAFEIALSRDQQQQRLSGRQGHPAGFAAHVGGPRSRRSGTATTASKLHLARPEIYESTPSSECWRCWCVDQFGGLGAAAVRGRRRSRRRGRLEGRERAKQKGVHRRVRRRLANALLATGGRGHSATRSPTHVGEPAVERSPRAERRKGAKKRRLYKCPRRDANLASVGRGGRLPVGSAPLAHIFAAAAATQPAAADGTRSRLSPREIGRAPVGATPG